MSWAVSRPTPWLSLCCIHTLPSPHHPPAGAVYFQVPRVLLISGFSCFGWLSKQKWCMVSTKVLHLRSFSMRCFYCCRYEGSLSFSLTVNSSEDFQSLLYFKAVGNFGATDCSQLLSKLFSVEYNKTTFTPQTDILSVIYTNSCERGVFCIALHHLKFCFSAPDYFLT